VLVVAAGFYFVYGSLMHYLPQNRKMREQLERDLDEAENELDEIEGKMSPKRGSKP